MDRPCITYAPHPDERPSRYDDREGFQIPAGDAYGAKAFDYYSVKDRTTAEAAEYGLMLWDGKSKGTVLHVVNLTRDHKPVVVYIARTRKFLTIRTIADPIRARSGRDLPT